GGGLRERGREAVEIGGRERGARGRAPVSRGQNIAAAHDGEFRRRVESARYSPVSGCSEERSERQWISDNRGESLHEAGVAGALVKQLLEEQQRACRLDGERPPVFPPRDTLGWFVFVVLDLVVDPRRQRKHSLGQMLQDLPEFRVENSRRSLHVHPSSVCLSRTRRHDRAAKCTRIPITANFEATYHKLGADVQPYSKPPSGLI